MKDFSGKIAVITGGSTGMGREMAQQLAAEGCSVAMCDINEEALAASKAYSEAAATQGARITTHIADVSIEAELQKFADEVAAHHETDHIDLLFNNAGIAGGGSLFSNSREAWERTFNVNWLGVYCSVRVFLPLLQKSKEARIINTSSVNGFWASVGKGNPHTAYSAAKFAVKGFTEALMEDLAVNAPHIKASVVMPGHIGTDIAINSIKQNAGQMGMEISNEQAEELGAGFRDNALTSAAEAAKIILDGVKAERWRILVGPDAVRLDEQVRATPEKAYEEDFFSLLAERQ